MLFRHLLIIKLYLLLLSLRTTRKENIIDVTTYTILYNKRKKKERGKRLMIGSKLNMRIIVHSSNGDVKMVDNAPPNLYLLRGLTKLYIIIYVQYGCMYVCIPVGILVYCISLC